MLGLRLNWHKRYITLGPVATLLGLAFKAYDPDHLVGQQEELGITVALIPTHLPGVEIGRRHLPAMQVFQNGPNWGHDVFIPLDYIIGGKERLGRGLEDADDGARRRPRHFAAVAVGGRRRLRRAHHRCLCPDPRAVQHPDRQVRRHRGAARPHRRHRLSARRRAAADLRRAQPGASSRGHLRHHEAAGDRADADRDRRRHGHPWRQGRDRRPAELPGQPLSLGAGRHHGGRRQHPDPQPDRVRAGRDPRAIPICWKR